MNGQPNKCDIGTFNDEVNSKCKTCAEGFYTEKRELISFKIFLDNLKSSPYCGL